jgi:hypothetical protein
MEEHVEATGEAGRPASYRAAPRIGILRKIVWGIVLVLALFLFYIVFGVFWFGLRAVAWTAEFRARRRRSSERSSSGDGD